jgi:choice-of-anchor A domain-containing protein
MAYYRYLAVGSLLAASCNSSHDGSVDATAAASFAVQSCSNTKIQELLSAGGNPVSINCSLSIPLQSSGERYTIHKDVIVRDEDVTDDPSGAVIDLSGVKIVGNLVIGASNDLNDPDRDRHPRLHDIKISNAEIHGSVRVRSGVSTDVLWYSSEHQGHTERLRSLTTTRIDLERLTISGEGESSLLYVENGVTNVTLTDSIVQGSADMSVIYLDSESGYHVIRNNIIRAQSLRLRPRITIDSSSHNRIVGNRFENLQAAGIYLFRNCGEDGLVRHQVPEHNQIINNWFDDEDYEGEDPAVLVGARPNGGNRDFCGDDDDVVPPVGSAIFDGDLPSYNVVAQNRIVGRSPGEMIRASAESHGHLFLANEEVPAGYSVRPSSCFIPNAHPSKLIEHGGVRNLLNIGGDLRCLNEQVTCNDGQLMTSANLPVEPYTLESKGSGFSVGHLNIDWPKQWQSDLLAMELIETQAFPLNFNALVFGNISGIADSEGALAAEGNVTLQSFSVNHVASMPVGIIAGGSVVLRSGSVFGHLFYGGEADSTMSTVSGILRFGKPIDFADAKQKLTVLSQSLAQDSYGDSQKGQVEEFSWGGVAMTGTDPALNVFFVSASQLSRSNYVSVSVPQQSSVLINVTDGSQASVLSMNSLGINIIGTSANRVLWNAPGLSRVELSSISFHGTLLAPNASVQLHNGNFNGTLVAGELIGNGELHHRKFEPWHGFAGSCPTDLNQATEIQFSCMEESNDQGCRRSIACPVGTYVARGKVACNLETTSLDPSALDELPWNSLRVANRSDTIADGHCMVENLDLSQSAAPLGSTIAGKSEITFGCREHDVNGGDCRINGKILCSPNPSEPFVFDFDCNTLSSNGGCGREVSCPSNTHIEQIKAACQLEYPKLSESVLDGIPWGQAMVVASGSSSEQNWCAVGDTKLHSGTALLDASLGRAWVWIGCQDVDANGGDCQIRARIRCVP